MQKKKYHFENHGCQLLLFLFIKLCVAEAVNCENVCEASAYKLVSLLGGDFAESRETFPNCKWLLLRFLLSNIL